MSDAFEPRTPDRDAERSWSPDDDDVTTSVSPDPVAPTLPPEGSEADAIEQRLEVPPSDDDLPR